ncbi:MAG TPA: PspC domain-containing protein [Acidimicrobiales bacterium]|nr:PspC domain-containing protein [Acidimicrobiales bacterium]
METVNDTNPPTDTPPYRRPGSRLTRSTDDKVLGGLAGGLGRYFGIDPVVFRIAFVVLTLAGGSGILLYLVGWLMIPDDAGSNALKRFGGERHQKLAAAVLAGAGLLILADNLTGGNDDIPLGLVLVGMGGLFLWSRNRNEVGAGPPPPPDHPYPLVPPPAPPAPPAGDAPTDATMDLPSAGTPDDADSVAGAEPPPPAPKPRKPPSALVPVTFSLLAVLAGAATLFGLSLTTGLCLALLLTGGALIVGAWRGRARWLIPVGLVLSVALAGASLIDVPIRGGTGDIGYRPLSVEEIRTPYRLSAGQLVVDLSDVDFRGQTVTVVASVAAGHLDIVVPRDVAIELDAHIGAGNLMLLGRETDGLDVGRRLTDRGQDGAGTLILRAKAGVGLVEVRRAFA